MLPPHTYLPRLYANYSDRNNCVQCDADEGCFKWYHWECEGITLFDLGDIKEYICKGCRGKNLGKMTYKGYNPAAELPDDAVQNEDETEEGDDEDVDEYLPESDDQDDSDGSDSDSESRNAKHGSKDSESDSDDSSVGYQEPITAGRKRKAASQAALKLKVQKTSEQSVSGSHKRLASGRVASSRPVRRRFQLTE